jgi:hypothetical protein
LRQAVLQRLQPWEIIERRTAIGQKLSTASFQLLEGRDVEHQLKSMQCNAMQYDH